MMRKIRFRGKDYNDNWVYGWLSGPNTIHFEPANKYKWTAESVLPETVGQFTGEIDKNLTHIYEGDVIEFTLKGEDIKNKKYGKVIYESSTFCIYTALHDVYRFDQVYFEFAEILGNVHDNHEIV